MGTPHKILRCYRKRGGGTLHISFEVICSDVQTGGDTAHKKSKDTSAAGGLVGCGGYVVGGWVGVFLGQ